MHEIYCSCKCPNFSPVEHKLMIQINLYKIQWKTTTTTGSTAHQRLMSTWTADHGDTPAELKDSHKTCVMNGQ